MTQLYVCSTTDVSQTRRWDKTWRLSGYCLFAAIVLTLALLAIAILLGNPREMLPPLDLGITPFGWLIIIVAILWVIGGPGRIVLFILRKTSR
jgi:hypothetical protein